MERRGVNGLDRDALRAGCRNIVPRHEIVMVLPLTRNVPPPIFGYEIKSEK